MKLMVSTLIAIGFLSATAAFGQTRPTQGQSGRQGVMQSFDRKSPAVGQQLPNVSAYNAAGETIQLRDLKGDYTVLVFGCLT